MNTAQLAPSSPSSGYLAQRGLKPAAELAANRPHGDQMLRRRRSAVSARLEDA